MRFRSIVAALALAATVAYDGAAAQEKYPSHTIRVIHPFGAGAASDVLARVLAERLSVRLGVPVIIDNRPSGYGVQSAVALKNEKPDGYSITILAGIHTVGVHRLGPNPPYDPRTDYEPIIRFFQFPNLIVTADRGIRSMADVMRLVNDQPKKVAIGTMPLGTPDYVTAYQLQQRTRDGFTIVPYHTPADMVTGVIRKDVTVAIQNYTVFRGALEKGDIRALAVTSAARLPNLPDVPTLGETGIPGIVNRSWGGFFAPRGTPSAVIEVLNREMGVIMRDAAFIEKARRFGIEPWPSTPSELARTMSEEIDRQGEVLRSAGLSK